MTDTLTRERVEAILNGCEGVTEGPWVMGRFVGTSVYCDDATGRRVADCDGEYLLWTREQKRLHAAHIARLDPATVRALCTAFLALEDARAEAFEEAAKIAEAHIGAAEKDRRGKEKLTGWRFADLSHDAQQEIYAEERGEKIASEIIARTIRARAALRE